VKNSRCVFLSNRFFINLKMIAHCLRERLRSNGSQNLLSKLSYYILLRVSRIASVFI